MDTQSKKVLIINLNRQETEIKAFTDLNKFVGGVSLGQKLAQMYPEYDPLVFSVGPLNGFFPFASKTSVVWDKHDLYLGGSLSFRIRFAGIDSIVILGSLKNPMVLDVIDGELTFRHKDTDLGTLGLPGKRSVLGFNGNELFLDEHFTTFDNLLSEKFIQKNICGFVITGTKVFSVKDMERYKELYSQILNRLGDVNAEKGNNPSCSGCPLGCDKAKIGEVSGNRLVHSLVACEYASKIYSDVGIVFSCLNVLGYDYTHEDLENLAKMEIS